MTAASEDAPRRQCRGLGGLLLTDVDRVDLGTHGRYALTARVERRRAALTTRRGWQLSLEAGRTCAVAIEVTDRSSGGARYDLPVPRNRDPRLHAARRVFALWLAAEALQSRIEGGRR